MDGDAKINEVKKYLAADKFILLSKSPAYADKTLLVQAVWDLAQQLLITAPRRFNKTANLRLLEAFFDLEPSTLEERRVAFSDKKISRTKAMDEFGKYPIIFANFSIGGEVTSLLQAKNCCRKIMYEAFYRHSYLLNSEKLKDSNGKPLPGTSFVKLERWLNQDLTEPDDDMIQNSLLLLARCLRLHHGVPPIVLIDEFDNICIKALFKCEETELDDIIFCYSDMVGNLLKTHKDEYTKAVLTGITSVTCKGLTTLSDLQRYRFLDSAEFAPFYGITNVEFDEMLDRLRSQEVISLKNDALSFYNGYEFHLENGKTMKILSTYSVVNFLAHKKVKPYWDGSGVVAGLKETIGSVHVIELTHDLLKGNTVTQDEIEADQPFHPSDLVKFNQIAKNPDIVFEGMSFLCYFLQQQGYVSIASRQNKIVGFTIPNEETRVAFLKILRSYYFAIYGFSEAAVNKCGNLLITLSKAEVNVEEQMNQLGTCFSELFATAVKHTNERMFEHLLFFIFFHVRYFFDIDSQEKVGKAKDRRKLKIYDLCLTAKTETNADFVFELKVDNTASSALDQIVHNKYYTACKSKRYYLIGVNLKNEPGKNLISMEYLVNEITLSNRAKCEIAAP